MLRLNYEAAHRFVDGYPNANWDGWTIELFKPNPTGATSRRGAFRRGEWGILTRVEVDARGYWCFRV